MFEQPIFGDTPMQSNMSGTPLNSKSSNSSPSDSNSFDRLVLRLDAAVVGESLHDVMLAMASVIAKRFGSSHFGLVSHPLSSMMAVVRSGSHVVQEPKRKKK